MLLQRVKIKYDKQDAVRIGGRIVDFLLPPVCPATGELVDRIGMVSAEYWKNLNFIQSPFCDTCGLPFPHDDDDMAGSCGACLDHAPVYRRARAALAYDDHSRDLILRFKHGDQTHAAQVFVPWMIQAGQDLLHQADIILPVPLHRMRLLKRRYNQADLIARELAKYYPDAAYYPDGLIRTKNTIPQGHKSRKERAENIKRAFTLNPRYDGIFDGKTILLVDDVYTTGATVNECAKTLYRAGAKAVDVLTIAKIVRT